MPPEHPSRSDGPVELGVDPLKIRGDRGRLAQAAQALGLELDGRTIDQLLAYRDLLQRWNRVYNLTSVRDPSDMLPQHLLDCLSIVPSLARALRPDAAAVGAAAAEPDTGVRPRILDVGSGGGLPGVVLALVQPGWDVSCVDAVAKKAAFVRQVGAELGLSNLVSHHARVQTLAAGKGVEAFDLITSRAFASLADFTHLTRHLLKPAGQWVAMKGVVPTAELARLGPEATLFHVEPLTVPGLAAQRCLVWLKP